MYRRHLPQADMHVDAHDDYMERLCKILGAFAAKNGMEIPCICLLNEIAEMEAERNTWRMPPEFNKMLRLALGVGIKGEQDV